MQVVIMAFRVDSARLARVLQERFRNQGRTQSEVATALGVSQGQISKILAGKFSVGEGLPARICKYAQIDLDDFRLESSKDPMEAIAAVRRFCRGDRRRENLIIRLISALNEL
jgi:transcriptional regulator with XRE-family HTH domain